MSKLHHNSAQISSNQTTPHENLNSVVRKHFTHSFKKPIAAHTQSAFLTIVPEVEQSLQAGQGLIFDSCCGTGMSTALLAAQYPECLVLGIDRSDARLSKTYNATMPKNVLLVQAECADFWWLANQAGWRLQLHTLYYPNPYPKAKHLKRRWHAHPAYPLLFALGGELELRTNWRIYAEEFCAAFEVAKECLGKAANDYNCSGVEELKISQEYMSLFEKKYYLSGQKLYSCKYGL